MKKLIHWMYKHRGLELQPVPLNPFVEQQRLLGGAGPSVIFDVGAHYGETVREYRALFPAASIYSFEPFSDSFAVLEQTAKKDANVHAYMVALSDHVGESPYSVNGNSATNSLLPVAAQASQYWGHLVRPERVEQVSTTTIDAFCEVTGIESIDVLKLDVQGCEPLVLRGAERMLRRQAVRLVYAEIIAVPCYDKQVAFDEFLAMMRRYGFLLHNFYAPHLSETGRLKQCDAIFVRGSEDRQGPLGRTGGSEGPCL